MSRFHLVASTVLGAAGILLATVGLPAADLAAPPPPNISITSAGPDGNGDPYDLTIIADDANGSPITSMTAHVFNASLSDAATLYAAASDNVPAGPQEQTTLKVTPSQNSVTEGSQSVTFNGTVTGVTPGDSTPQAIVGAPVDLSVGGGSSSQIATTDSSGDFTYTVNGISEAATYAFSVALTDTYTAATDNVPIAVDPARTQILGHVSPAHLKYGQNATFTGTVQYLSGTTWTDLAGVAVQLAEGKTSLGSVITSAKGSFTATLPTTHGSAWSATVSMGNLIQQASAVGNLSIAVPMKVRWFHASLGANGMISASGCLEVTAPVNYGPRTTIDIQYATAPGGRWNSLGRLRLYNVAHKNPACSGAVYSYFSGAIRAKLANAYYRADFVANYSFQGAVSKIIHAWRYQTRIISFNVTPRSLPQGKIATITGRLEVRGKSWIAFGSQKIKVMYNQKGISYRTTLTELKTNSNGYFSTQAHGQGSAPFVVVMYAVYVGDTTHLACQSGSIDLLINSHSRSGRVASTGIEQPPFLAAPTRTELEPVVLSFASLAQSKAYLSQLLSR